MGGGGRAGGGRGCAPMTAAVAMGLTDRGRSCALIWCGQVTHELLAVSLVPPQFCSPLSDDVTLDYIQRHIKVVEKLICPWILNITCIEGGGGVIYVLLGPRRVLLYLTYWCNIES